MRYKFLPVLTVLLSFVVIPAYALPGEAAAVVRQCGAPSSENMGTSQVPNGTQRNVTYGDTVMQFVPDGSGWSFATALRSGLPVSRSSLADAMPCFKAALADAAEEPIRADDSTVAQQVQSPAAPRDTTWIIPDIGFILLLATVMLVFAFAPRRKAKVLRELPTARGYGKYRLSEPYLSRTSIR